MALSILTPEIHPVPSAAWIVCAACGPLSEDRARRADISFQGEPGLRCRERRYEVAEAVPFPTLRHWVMADAAIQEAIEAIEADRRQGGAKRRPLSYEEMAGSARASLLLGREKAFLQRYREYAQVKAYEWHPDPEHGLFWDRVLGPGWAGSAFVPAGPARDELLLLSASAFAFLAPPANSVPGAGLCGAPDHEEWLEMAAALRVADGEALAERSQQGSEAARAAGEMLAGAFESAQQSFERLFGRSDEKRYVLVQNHGLPLLLYALVGGIFAKGGPRFLHAWFEAARYAVQYVYPVSMEQEQAEMMRFIDHLEQVDSLLNRNGILVEQPRFIGALSQLPFAMAYSALPGYVRQHLSEDELAASVEELARRGLLLLAHYGRSGLRGAMALSRERREALERMPGDARAVLPTLPQPATERACEALADIARRYARQGYEPLQVPDALTPVLIASRARSSVLLDLEEAEVLYEQDCPPALRYLRKYAPNGLAVLEGASAAELTRLFIALQPQVDVVGSLALPDEALVEARPEPVLLLAHTRGGNFFAALRLRLLPDTSPLMTPGCGLEVPVLEGADGKPVAVQRDSRGEWKQIEAAVRRLKKAGLPDAETLKQGKLSFSGFAALAALLKTCRELGLPCCWEQGHELRLHQPQGGLMLHRGPGSGEWLELGGGLPVEEERVLELSSLLKAFSAREGDTLQLGAGEYVLLNPDLERQLALLELVLQEKRGKQGVATSAIPLLEALEKGAAAGAAPEAPVALPVGLQATLRPYQAEGYRWLAQRAGTGPGGLLADDMGLGKTVQVLALLLHASCQDGAAASLVVAPVSLLQNWAEEAARFAPSLEVRLYDPKNTRALAGLSPRSLVLASYGQIASRQKDFAALEWGVIVLDEAQAIKNPDAQRAKAVCTLRARARFCLTGTPIENSLLDLWSQMRFLSPGLFGSRASFQRRFKKISPAQLTLLRQVLSPLVLRRTKAEVLPQLPPLTETIEWVEFSKEERALYESLRRAAVDRLGQGSEAAGGIGILAELTRLRRACCHGKLALDSFEGGSAKMAAMAERVQELRAAGRCVLIFSQFTDVLDLAQEALQREGCSCLRLDGSTPAARRAQAVHQFQEGGADAFLISLKAGGAGLNLTAADYVMLLDPWWNPAVEAQAAGRSHRMGQQQPVTLCRFMVRGTVEERILDMHREKKELAEQVLSGHAERMDAKALRELLAEG